MNLIKYKKKIENKIKKKVENNTKNIDKKNNFVRKNSGEWFRSTVL